MHSKPNIHLYLIDDDPSVLRSLCALVSAHGMQPHPFGSAEAFLENFEPDQPGCVLLDIRMPGMSGLQLQSKLSDQGANFPVIILTGHGDVPAAVQAMKNGAIDFIEKPLNVDSLLRSIAEATALLNNQPRQSIPKHEVMKRVARLTRREREVLDHLVLGKINKQIAVEMGISQRTVEIHRARLQKKVEANGLADLIRMMKALA